MLPTLTGDVPSRLTTRQFVQHPKASKSELTEAALPSATFNKRPIKTLSSDWPAKLTFHSSRRNNTFIKDLSKFSVVLTNKADIETALIYIGNRKWLYSKEYCHVLCILPKIHFDVRKTVVNAFLAHSFAE